MGLEEMYKGSTRKLQMTRRWVLGCRSPGPLRWLLFVAWPRLHRCAALRVQQWRRSWPAHCAAPAPAPLLPNRCSVKCDKCSGSGSKSGKRYTCEVRGCWPACCWPVPLLLRMPAACVACRGGGCTCLLVHNSAAPVPPPRTPAPHPQLTPLLPLARPRRRRATAAAWR